MKLSHRQTTLGNGLRVLTCAMPHTYSVSVGLFLSVGSRYEEPRVAGAAHFLEHMFFKGTERRPSSQAIAAALEGNGGLYNAGTGRETTVLWAKMQQPHMGLALEVLSDMLRNSRMVPQDIEKERRIILEEINASLDVPEELVSLVAHDITWPGHPLGGDIAGTPASIAGLGRADLERFFHGHYGPGNTVVSVSGDVDHAQVVETAHALLGNWQLVPPPTFLPAPVDSSGPQVALTSRPTEQTHLTLHFPGLARHDHDRFALGMLNVILGEGMSSRLFLEIREQLGLAYAVDSYTSFLSDTGLIGIYAAVAEEQTIAALRAILDQLRRLRVELVSEDELRVAREYTKGRMLLGMEDTLAVASWYGRQEVLAGPLLSVEETISRVQQVTAADILQVAGRVFLPSGARLALVGPNQGHELDRLQTLLAEELAPG